MISILSIVSISWCIYLTLISKPSKYAVKSSAIFFVSVVTRTLSPRSTLIFISLKRSSIWSSVGLTVTIGSSKPVGLMICSTICVEASFSKSPGVADVKIT